MQRNAICLPLPFCVLLVFCLLILHALHSISRIFPERQPHQKDQAKRHAWQDLPVQLLEDGQPVLAGLCHGVAADGALLIETATGLQRILSGDLSLRRR